MSDNINKNTSSAENISASRRKRINRLKKIIIVTVICAILIPIIMCILLFIRVHKLEQKIIQLEEAGRVQETVAIPDENSSVSQEFDECGEILPAETSDDRINGTDGQDGTDGQNGSDLQEDELQQSVALALEEQENEPDEEAAYDGVRRIYLTFDDGPSIRTEKILEILAQYDVKATFFVTGKTDTNSVEMYRRIVEEGHTLGLHSYSHKYKEIYSSVEAFTEDLQKLRDYLYDITGVRCTVYRFPGGSSNTVSNVDIQDLIDVLEEEGIEYFDWNASSGDGGSRTLSVREILSNVLTDAEEYHNMVILMHDSADKPTTVEALPELIEQLLALPDTEILPITESTVRVQHVKPE